MGNYPRPWHRSLITLAMVAFVAGGGIWAVVRAAGAASPEPGSPEDPLVSKSFVEQYVQQLLQNRLVTDIQQQLQPLAQQTQQAVQTAQQALQAAQQSQASTQQQGQFVVVSVAKGARVVAESSTEIVLRAGQATVVASNLGGLADLTSGIDLPQGAAVPANHHLLAARSDGRGLTAVTDVVLLVRGQYTLQTSR